MAGPRGPGGPGRLLLGGREGGVKASLQWKRGGSEGGEEEAWGAGGEPRSEGTRLDRRAAPQLYVGALRLMAGGGGGAGEGALPLGRKQGLPLPPEGTGSGSLGGGKSPPGPARGGKVWGTGGGSGGREPGPPLSGVVGGTRQGGWVEGGPGDTVWNNWGLAPSPGEECEQVVSMLRYRVAMATAFRRWLHSLVMSSSDAGPTPAPPGVTGAKGSKLKTLGTLSGHSRPHLQVPSLRR